MIREASVEAHLVRRVNALGGITAKLAVPGRRGWPDRLVILPNGGIFLVELKRPKGGRLSMAQRVLHAHLSRLGCPVAVLSSVEAIDTFLGAIA